MVIKNEQYIMLWNNFTDLESENRLTPDELYLWCFLYTMRKYNDESSVNVYLIEGLMPLQYYPSRPVINRDRIRQLLISLKNKKVIDYDIKDETLSNKKNDHLAFNIKLQCWSIKDERYDKEKHFSGYETFSNSEFFEVKDKIDFYVIAAIRRFERMGGRDCSDEEWAMLLDVSYSTARRRVNKLVEEGIIYKKSGKWESYSKQSKNTYSTKPFLIKHDLVLVEKKIKEEDNKQDNVEQEQVKIEWGNWNDKTAYLKEHDFYLYWKFRDDKEFASLCDKRLKILEGKRDFSDWLEEGKLKFESEMKKLKKQNEESKIVNAVILDGNKIQHLNKKNFDLIDWGQVKRIYYFDETENGHSLNNGEFHKLANQSGHQSEEISRFAINEYRKLVVKNEKLTIEKIKQIRNRARELNLV